MSSPGLCKRLVLIQGWHFRPGMTLEQKNQGWRRLRKGLGLMVKGLGEHHACEIGIVSVYDEYA